MEKYWVDLFIESNVSLENPTLRTEMSERAEDINLKRSMSEL